MPTKTKLDKLRSNVQAQESRLEEAIKSLKAVKQASDGPAESSASDPHWDALERIVGLMEDLLVSYRTYTEALQKHLPKEGPVESRPANQMPESSKDPSQQN